MRIAAHELTTEHRLMVREDEESEYRTVIVEGFADAHIDEGWFEVLGYFDDNGDDFCRVLDTSESVVVE